MGNDRNQPCTCGSGKKYKKCCMGKNSVIDLHKVKEERFYEKKDILVSMITDFIRGKLNPSAEKRMQQIFDYRTENTISENIWPMMYHFFTLFIHRFENGLRGVEWFYKEKEASLDTNIGSMAKTWTSLQFRLVQVVDIAEDKLLFEDVIT